MLLGVGQIKGIVEALDRKRPFSGVVSVQEGEKVLFEKGYGLANRAEAIPNTPRTRFQMASGCKIFTSVAICQLVEKGKVSFDTSLGRCLDVSFRHFDPNITLHHLLTHSSGITSYFEEDVDDDYEALWKDRPMYGIRSPRDFLPMFQDKKMKFTPGERFDYNDGGFILLGLVVEQLSGMSFSSYVEENILTVCGMADSGYFATDRLPGRTAYAYIKNEADQTWRTNFFAVPIVGGPDGGAYTTAPDMAKFWSALLDNRLLTEDVTDQLLCPQIAARSEGADIYYGYGVWMFKPGDDVVHYYVEGWDPGVAFLSAVYPEKDVVITILGNTNRSVWPIHDEVVRTMGLA